MAYSNAATIKWRPQLSGGSNCVTMPVGRYLMAHVNDEKLPKRLSDAQ
ncbi:hypothetical protein [Moraxella catarrhalis]|nr:hypothetical protein [Moraxella catarrhalis]